MFKNENTYNSIFNPNKDFKGYLNCCLINKKSHNFWSKYTNTSVKLKTSNFKLHIGCIIVKEFYKKRNVTFDEIANINIEDIDEIIFNESIIFLSDTINRYLSIHTDKNLINIAKSKDFTTYILDQINNKYIGSN